MERLSGLDASFLYLETSSALLNVCGLILLERSEHDFDSVHSALERCVAAVPDFRKKLQDSILNLDHPAWIEDPEFDVERHIHRVVVPAPGGPRELADLCGLIAGGRLDRSHPLWEMWLIEGLADGSNALMAKMHHATVDGVTGANMMTQMFSLSPDAPPPGTSSGVGPGNRLALVAGSWLSVLGRPVKLARVIPETAGMLAGWLGRAVRGEAMPPPFVAPRTGFNRNITGHRNIAFAQLDLAAVIEVKTAFGLKINDVVLAICAGALRRYLENRHELPESPLICVVPMSVHERSDRPGTNQVSAMSASLATDITDPVERLHVIAKNYERGKAHGKAISPTILHDWAQLGSQSLLGVGARAYSGLHLAEHHPVVHNLVISNVAGPPAPLYFLGARIIGMFPFGPIMHGAGLNITVISGDGRLDIGLIGCPELIPELWSLAEAMSPSLDELLGAARTIHPEPPSEARV
ncbi:MAG: wax ester/triacylglycerol synthase family O-acyltransferase [Rhodococcus sp. (in: high G+C Gram-positive bacteria)]|uniref:WS/DGAT/MGAT family O-acyltransferase n=1 Tax=Rhodococcus sp. TaxID=1831 RepID=UPI003BB153D9